MVVKKKVCKSCGYFTEEKLCPLCQSNSFAEKHKGKIIIFDSENSIVAKKLEIKNNGLFALKFK